MVVPCLLAFIYIALIYLIHNERVLLFVRSDIIGCPLQWNQFGCSCFLFGSKDSINWDSARERCRRYPGSHLATISTKAENNFVGMQLKNTSWLGLRRRANGKLTQEGEERGSFFAWDSTTASRSKTGCIAARPTKGRTWMAQECSKQYKYICEKTVSKGKNRSILTSGLALSLNVSEFFLCL